MKAAACRELSVHQVAAADWDHCLAYPRYPEAEDHSADSGCQAAARSDDLPMSPADAAGYLGPLVVLADPAVVPVRACLLRSLRLAIFCA